LDQKYETDSAIEGD